VRDFIKPLPDAVMQAPRWWVGLSGGADSVALLHALCGYAKEHAAPPIHAIHVNHGLQPEADAWSALCQRQADALGVPLEIAPCEVTPSGRGLEADARSARYSAFEAVLSANDVLFTAHHADDMVETLFLRLLRGAGPRGLAGIPEQRACGEGFIFRPFLDVPSSSLRAAVEAAGLEYVIDPSNIETEQDRSYLRQTVLPLIAERWPGYRDTVLRAAHLQAVTQQRLATLPLDRTFTLLGEPALVIDRALGPPALAAQIHQWLTESDLESPDQSRLMELARQALTAKPDRSPELVWDRHCLRAWNGLIVRVIDPASSQLFPSEVVVGEPAEGEWGRLDWQPVNDGIGLAGEMRLLTQLSGGLASMSLPNRPAKPVAKWLQELRIPPWWRSHLPVFLVENDPVWMLSVGAVDGQRATEACLQNAGFTPVWQLFNRD
jgi:tRNA(Ile)-lysidine synthase